jgi:RNase P subunit RPR2
MGCSICAKNQKTVTLTCENCGRTKNYTYKKRSGLVHSLKIKKLYCRCGLSDRWDIENAEEHNDESTN